ncbi:MAG TPA: glycosyltransferase [Polyangium sp.]|nr:glycosyltransferase [Polyangium sp.]
MFDIRVDPIHAIIEFIVDGPVKESDAAELLPKLEAASVGLSGRELKIKADIRGRDHATNVIGPMVRTLHAFAKQTGVQRLAEIVESDTVAGELNRAAKEIGTDKILRRFWEDDSAREWLIYGDLSPSSIGARWR